MKIRGKIISGLGAATGTIAKQKIYLKSHVPDIETCHNGTINLLLEAPLFIREPNAGTTPIVKWHPHAWPEKFSFHKIQLELEKMPDEPNEIHDAYIYIAHNSPHYNNLFLKEIIAPYINLRGVTHCNIILDEAPRNVGIFVVD